VAGYISRQFTRQPMPDGDPSKNKPVPALINFIDAANNVTN